MAVQLGLRPTSDAYLASHVTSDLIPETVSAQLITRTASNNLDDLLECRLLKISKRFVNDRDGASTASAEKESSENWIGGNEVMTNLERVRKFLRDGNEDLSQISLREIRYALHDIIGKAQPLRRTNREAANRLQAEIPAILRLKAQKLASIGEDALADEMLRVRKRMRDPDRINIYDQTDWDCLVEAEKTLR